MPLERSSGIILHPTSLPSIGGIGDLGPAAYVFADYLAAAGQRVWQVLPLNPTGWGDSPYAATSAFAGNPLLISLEKLADWGWISHDRLRDLPQGKGRVDYAEASFHKAPLLIEAARNFMQRGAGNGEVWGWFESYCGQQAHWLNPYAQAVVLRRKFFDKGWPHWSPEFVRRDPAALAKFELENGEELAIEQVIQFAFDSQWRDLRNYCAQRGIKLMGDIAIFVSFDSVDVWTHADIFDLDESLQPIFVSGVPPDYFSAMGQRWGNPLYKWDVLKERKFDWWLHRVRRARELYDLIRLDHFRGFEAYWRIDAAEETAINGKWVKAPGDELFSAFIQDLGEMPFIAEDLGLITPEVVALRERFNMPGMCILQFAFGDRGGHMYLPHSYTRNTVVYTGTHDNDTTLGWWHNGASDLEKAAALTYLRPDNEGIVWAMIRAAATSVADLCMMPLQDVMGLGSDARMNVPSGGEGNWSWRFTPDQLRADDAQKLATLMDVTDRTHQAQFELAKIKEEAMTRLDGKEGVA